MVEAKGGFWNLAWPRNANGGGTFRLVAAAVLLMALAAGPALAVEKKPPPKPMTFMGVKVKPLQGQYLVLRDVNIRARPKTKSKRVGSFKAGKRINVVGRAAGAWVAVREGGKDLGFVYDQILLPLIDGTLEKDIEGKASVKGGVACQYRIRFEGKSQVEGQVFEIADYDVYWDCLDGKRKVKFRTPMFITEAPYQLGTKRIFQISIDVLDIEGGYDDIFSTTLLYDKDKNSVAFDSVSIEKFGQTPATKEIPAKTVPQALVAAVRISLSAWNKSAWRDLIKNSP
ncbi:MAG: SH3 domain-containing protein [Proteobacteria bacterium]|nr:SH3 domain-containing protein [Pseudomonadota bacterium]